MGKKLLLFFATIGASFFLSGCTLKKAPAALQINTTPASNVFIDGKLLGKTPYQSSDFKEGEIVIKLIPESTDTPLSSWESKIKLTSGVLTLIDRELSASENTSSGQILTLEKIKDTKSAAMSIISDPDGALIKINGEAKGFSPLTQEGISEGDYEISASKENYIEKRIKAKVAMGYKLIVNVKLSQGASQVVITPSPTRIPSGKITPSAKVTPVGKITPTGKVTPKPTLSSSDNLEKPYVLIKDTPTGWLRVRTGPAISGTELAKVNPGEQYPLLGEQTGWYKIQYASGKEGWVSSQYAEKFE